MIECSSAYSAVQKMSLVAALFAVNGLGKDLNRRERRATRREIQEMIGGRIGFPALRGLIGFRVGREAVVPGVVKEWETGKCP